MIWDVPHVMICLASVHRDSSVEVSKRRPSISAPTTANVVPSP